MPDVSASGGEGLEPDEAQKGDAGRAAERSFSFSWEIAVGVLLLLVGGGLFAYTHYRR